MIVKVVNRNNQKIEQIYTNVKRVFIDTGKDGEKYYRIKQYIETETYPAKEYEVYKYGWEEII